MTSVVTRYWNQKREITFSCNFEKFNVNSHRLTQLKPIQNRIIIGNLKLLDDWWDLSDACKMLRFNYPDAQRHKLLHVIQYSIPVRCIPTVEVASIRRGFGGRVYTLPDTLHGTRNGPSTRDTSPPPPVNRHRWKHYLPATSFAVGKNIQNCSNSKN